MTIKFKNLFYLFIFLIPFVGFVVPTRASLNSMTGEGFGFQWLFVVILLIVLFLIIQQSINSNAIFWLPQNSINGMIFLLFFIVLCSGIWASINFYEIEGLQMRVVRQSLQFTINIIVYLIVICSIKNKQILFKTIQVLLWSSFFVALYGIYQMLGFLHLVPSIDFLFFNPSFGHRSGIVGHPLISMITIPRINSVLSEPIVLANFLFLPLSFLFVGAFLKVHYLSKIFDSVLLWLCLLVFILTFSKMGFIILLIGLFLFSLYCLIILRAQKKNWLIFTIKSISLMVMSIFGISVIAAVFLGANVWFVWDIIIHRMTELSASVDLAINSYNVISYNEGVEVTQSMITASKIFFDYPILGVGWGNIPSFFFSYSYYQSTAMNPVWAGVHSIYLRFLAETGLIGFTSFIILLFFLLRKLIRICQRTLVFPREQAIAFGLLLAFILNHINQIIGDFSAMPYYWFLIGFVVAFDNCIDPILAEYNNMPK